MKKITFILLSLLLMQGAMAAEKNLSALFGYSVFYLPESGKPYVETYLNFNAWTLNLVQDESEQYRATVEVSIIVKKGDTIAYVKKYDLHSPYTNKAEDDNFTFFDLQRFALGNGIYDMQLILRDKASNQPPFVFNDKLIIYFPEGEPSMSNIQLMASATPTEETNMLSRNGYDMVPYINDFVPASIKELHPYIEIYNLDKEVKNDPYVVYYSIEQKETGQRIAAYDTFIRRNKGKTNDPVYGTVDISLLPSGNYNLVARVRNLKGETLMRKELTFHRSNPKVSDDAMAEEHVATSFAGLITDQEKLNYYIDALYPISSPDEVSIARNIVKGDNLAEKQSFFYHFWLRRDLLDPQGKWNEYLTRLNYVDAHFSYPKTRGYMTDRGRVYLQYGPPDHIRDEKNFVGALHINTVNDTYVEEGASRSNAISQTQLANQGHIHYLPYQIWRYNRLENDYPNRVFLFWDEFRSGYYRLLNSSARGELITPNWERVLSQNQLEEDTMGEVGQQFERGF